MSVVDRDFMREPPLADGRRALVDEDVARSSGPSAAMAILALNVIVFLLEVSGGRLASTVLETGLMQPAAVLHGQVWRLLTATYLHAGFDHIFANMLGLYFFGPPLEALWGSKRFVTLYTLGGVAGNLVLTVAGAAGVLNPFLLGLGASGSVLTLLGAAAVHFPQARLYLYFLVPIKLRTFAVVYAGWFVFNIAGRGHNYGGDICHLVGLLIGAGYARWRSTASL